MNIGALWDQLVGAVCRPPRDTYEESDLVGGVRASFKFGETRSLIKKYYRQDITLKNARGQRLECSHYRPCVVTSTDGRLPCVIYCHTNSGSRRDAEEILFSLLPKGITVFAFDFSGSGLSEGDWVTLGALEIDDLSAVVQYIREEGSTSTLALWGRSMGAVTALLYSHRDPSIAGVVADSPFSRLVDLMLELGTDSQQQGGLSVPRPLVKMALTMMRRSVRRRAAFSIDDVSPLDVVPECFVPVLLGHGSGDTFIPPHHSERLFTAHGAETKNYISFEGNHNGVRPDFWYDSALIFLLGVLRVEELVGPSIDLNVIDLMAAPHLMGKGIYVAGSGSPSSTGEGGGDDDDGEDGDDSGGVSGGSGGGGGVNELKRSGGVVRRGRIPSVGGGNPWNLSNTTPGESGGGLERYRSEVANLSKPPPPPPPPSTGETAAAAAGAAGGRGEGFDASSQVNHRSQQQNEGGRGTGGVVGTTRDEEEGDDGEDIDGYNEEAMLQQAIAMSLADDAARHSTQFNQDDEGKSIDGASSLQQQQQQGEEDDGGDDGEERYDEEAALAAAIAESLKYQDQKQAGADAVIEEQEGDDDDDGGGGGGEKIEKYRLEAGEKKKVSFCEKNTSSGGGGSSSTSRRQSLADEHAGKEAAAVHAASEVTQHAFATVVQRESLETEGDAAVYAVSGVAAKEAAEGAVRNDNEEEDSDEKMLEELRLQAAKLSGHF